MTHREFSPRQCGQSPSTRPYSGSTSTPPSAPDSNTAYPMPRVFRLTMISSSPMAAVYTVSHGTVTDRSTAGFRHVRTRRATAGAAARAQPLSWRRRPDRRGGGSFRSTRTGALDARSLAPAGRVHRVRRGLPVGSGAGGQGRDRAVGARGLPAQRGVELPRSPHAYPRDRAPRPPEIPSPGGPARR